MLESFDESTRSIIIAAQKHAGSSGRASVLPGDLLTAFAALGSERALRGIVEFVLQPTAVRAATARVEAETLPFDPAARSVIAAAYDTALLRGSSCVEPGDLLLATLLSRDPSVEAALVEIGATERSEAVRRAGEWMSPVAGSGMPRKLVDAFRDATTAAAAKRHDTEPDDGDLLLALIDRSFIGTRALELCGVDHSALVSAIESARTERPRKR